MEDLQPKREQWATRLGAILAVPVVASMREVLVYVHAKINQQDPFPEKQRAQPQTDR